MLGERCRWCGYDVSRHLEGGDEEFICPECGKLDRRAERGKAARRANRAWIIWGVGMVIVPSILWNLMDATARGWIWGRLDRSLGDATASRVVDRVILGVPIVFASFTLLGTWLAGRVLQRTGRRAQGAALRIIGVLITVFGGLAWLGYCSLGLLMRGIPPP